MKGKASDICTKCKHCEGMVEDSFYVCGESHSDGGLYHLMPAEDELYCTAYEGVNMNKVEGKVSDICPNCKNGKVVVWEGVSNIECEDPYDGMIKNLAADSNIRCSMFEPKSDKSCEKCERFDGTYCHSPNGIFVTSYMAMFGDYATGNCPLYDEKKEKEPFDFNMSREALEAKILDLFEEKNRLNGIINSLEKEKVAHLKGIERLKKSQEKVKNLQTTNEESYKREEKLEDKIRKLERRLLDESKRRASLDTEFLIPLAHVLYPREAKICKPYSEVLKDIKLLNKGIYDLEEDCKRLADKNKSLKSDIDTLQNAVLEIHNIAQVAYNDIDSD